MFNYNPDIEKRIIVFLDEYFGRLLMILIYQTLYNYMYLIYFSDLHVFKTFIYQFNHIRISVEITNIV